MDEIDEEVFKRIKKLLNEAEEEFLRAKPKERDVISEKEYEELEKQVTRIKMSIGGLWEEQEWEIAFNVPVEEEDDLKLCSHCRQPFTVVHKRSDGTSYKTKGAICPRVVIAVNEGGYSSTGVCLDCILEHANTLDENL